MRIETLARDCQECVGSGREWILRQQSWQRIPSEILKLECLVLVVEDIQTWQGMNPETAAMADKSLKH